MSINVLNLKYNIIEAGKERSILKDITYSLKEGAITTISGPSGSGKTTFLYALSGILDGCEGEVIINGQSIYQLGVSNRDAFRLNNITFIFQNLNLLPFMTVFENICLPYYLQKTVISKETKERISDYLEMINLGQIQNKSISILSGGEQQRVAIVRAMISNANIILCDEPTGSLDSENAKIFMDQISNINKTSNKKTIVIVTHNPEIFKQGDDRIKICDGILSEQD